MKDNDMPEWIHTRGDGRGMRLVFVGGVLQRFCFFADEKRKFAKIYNQPFDGSYEIVRGHVTVIPHP